MKRSVIVASAATVCLIALGLFAQSSRDAYRSAYRAWRQADPNLERDAGTAPTLVPRIATVAAQAARYGAARSSFLRQMTASEEQTFQGLDAPLPDLPDLTRGVRENVTAESALVKHNLDTFSRDSDRAIQQLKLMLDRENLALTALSTAIAERQAAAEAAKSAIASAEQARAKALNIGRDLNGAMGPIADQADRETAAWAEYYRKLADAARQPAAVPVIPSAPPPPTSITPLPLSRYTGAWIFPSAGLYHGPQPDSIDLTVREENGRAAGTLFVRYKLPPGSKDDPALRIDFSGEFKNTRNQVFSLQTAEGAKGTLELIPGPAFNLLEINFQTDPKPGKIQQGNAVLIKK
ncbi:MAG TPA: hypothetical protein VNX18_23475 [Bryobacteraceae bacterium]|nr:hypothetical protein [Bryobacteraceae bacterium]